MHDINVYDSALRVVITWDQPVAVGCMCPTAGHRSEC